MKAIELTHAQVEVAAAVLGHALDQAHDTIERYYLQMIVDGGEASWNPNEDREVELEALVGGVLDQLSEAASA